MNSTIATACPRSGRTSASFLFATLAWMAASVAPVHALTYTVGSGSGCTHATVAAALASAQASSGADTIRITRSGSYTQQAISFTTDQEVTLTGGYADCVTQTEDSTQTTIDGSGGAPATVLTINGGTGSVVRLRKLQIRGGDVAANSIAGGGIYYTGNGLLDIADSSINENTGAYGGGINAGGTNTEGELDIGPNTTLFGNTALYNGGGIFSNNIETAIRGDNIWIDFNTATGVNVGGGSISGGYGGGIHIRACVFNSIVYLGSPGVGSAGVVYSNSARYGGGVALQGADGCDHDKRAELRMYSVDAARLTKIQANQASVAGGGVYMQPFNAFNSSQPTSTGAYFWNASIEDNSAPDASALYLGSDSFDLLGSYGSAWFNAGSAPEGTIFCPAGTFCGRISGNISDSSGRVIAGEESNELLLYNMVLNGNVGSELIRLDRPVINDSLLVRNTVSGRLIQARRVSINDSTIADNVIGGAQTLASGDGGTDLHNLIIWQPGKPVLTHSSPLQPGNVTYVLANEAASLQASGSIGLSVADPRFVDAAHSDYSLTIASPAVDYAPAVAGDDYDLVQHRRDLDIAIAPDNYGPRDLGAFEREFVQPLVRNSNFDANLYLWSDLAPGASSWDPSQNAAGPAGSGSMLVNLATTATNVSARVQCVHLPGPGDYVLNGYGKSTGNGLTPGDNVKLFWEYRSAGSEACTGSVTRSGSLLLANSSAWQRPVTGAHIVVSNFEWTTDSSVAIYSIVEEDGGIGGAPGGAGTNADVTDASAGSTLKGWFDGITLELNADVIFENGFE